MPSTGFVLLKVVAPAFLLLHYNACSAQSDVVYADVRAGLSAAAAAVQQSFLGLSFQFDYAASHARNSPYQLLIKNLAVPGTGPVSLRIKASNSQNEELNITRGTWMNLLSLQNNMTLDDGPGMSFIIGLPIKSPTASTTAYNMVQNISQVLPLSSIKAFEMGNEPDLYPKKSPQEFPADYVKDVAKGYAQDAIKIAKVIRPLLESSWGSTRMLSGPACAGQSCVPPTTWGPAFAAATEGMLASFNNHLYVGDGRDPDIKPTSLLRESKVSGPVADAAEWVAMARSLHLSYRVGEMNSLFGGGGPNVSNTLAAALWTADISLALAAAGVEGINFHGGVCYAYSAITLSNSPSCAGTGTVARPPYFGMLLVQRALAYASRVWQVRAPTSADGIKIYGLLVPTLSARGSNPSTTTSRLTCPVNGDPLNATLSISIAGTLDAVLNASVQVCASALAVKGALRSGVLNLTLSGTLNGTLNGTRGLYTGRIVGNVSDAFIDGVATGMLSGRLQGGVKGPLTGSINGSISGTASGSVTVALVSGRSRATVSNDMSAVNGTLVSRNGTLLSSNMTNGNVSVANATDVLTKSTDRVLLNCNSVLSGAFWTTSSSSQDILSSGVAVDASTGRPVNGSNVQLGSNQTNSSSVTSQGVVSAAATSKQAGPGSPVWPAGSSELRFVVLHKGGLPSPRDQVVGLLLKGAGYGVAAVQRLEGPGAAATTGVTMGGQAATPLGSLTPPDPITTSITGELLLTTENELITRFLVPVSVHSGALVQIPLASLITTTPPPGAVFPTRFQVPGSDTGSSRAPPPAPSSASRPPPRPRPHKPGGSRGRRLRDVMLFRGLDFH